MANQKNHGGKFKFLKSNENEDSTYQKIWGMAKATLKAKFIAESAYIEKS